MTEKKKGAHTRDGKVALMAYIDPELRDAFNQAAKFCGLTTQDLLTFAAQTLVSRIRTNPAIAKDIAAQIAQQKEARERLLGLVGEKLLDFSKK